MRLSPLRCSAPLDHRPSFHYSGIQGSYTHESTVRVLVQQTLGKMHIEETSEIDAWYTCFSGYMPLSCIKQLCWRLSPARINMNMRFIHLRHSTTHKRYRGMEFIRYRYRCRYSGPPTTTFPPLVYRLSWRSPDFDQQTIADSRR